MPQPTRIEALETNTHDILSRDPVNVDVGIQFADNMRQELDSTTLGPELLIALGQKMLETRDEFESSGQHSMVAVINTPEFALSSLIQSLVNTSARV